MEPDLSPDQKAAEEAALPPDAAEGAGAVTRLWQRSTRPVVAQPRLHRPSASDRRLLDHLRRTRQVDPGVLAEVRALLLRDGLSVREALTGRGQLSLDRVLELQAEALGTSVWRGRDGGDAGLIDRIGLRRCLSAGILPLGPAGGAVLLAVARPDAAQALDCELRAAIGPFRTVLAAPDTIQAALLRQRRARLARIATSGLDPDVSCRGWRSWFPIGPVALTLMVLAALLGAAPRLLFAGLLMIAVVTLVLGTALKVIALFAAMTRRRDPKSLFHSCRRLPLRELPAITLLVPLFREENVATHLVERLSALDYPKDRLEVALILEERDSITRAALAGATLPSWMRVIEVPPGVVQTKPRALNYALPMTEGEIVGIYDAEDRPEPDQLRRVAVRFADAPPDLACLQGALDYYNPRQGWMARCFTLEYAAWFRLLLPGLARLRLIVPLGGTSLFLRRAAIERAGGWDAWNVTEDADLGVRLARMGLRTEPVDTATYEEATCRPWPWIRQRSRWLKGYAMTWAVHSRHSRALWQSVGPRAFVGFHVLFLGTLCQFLLAPLLWSLWLFRFGVPHPVLPVLGPEILGGLTMVFMLAEAINIGATLVGIRRTGHRGMSFWLPLLYPYFALGTLAAWKAMFELVTCPFYWDKTSHGHSLALGLPEGQERSSRFASALSLTS